MQEYDEIGSPTVTIDGLSVKRIRENKNLTQLYIATVVGVTPDTISRWEKKTSANIRQENAARLAEALEVAIDTITVSANRGPENVISSKRHLHLIIGVATLTLLTFILITQFNNNTETSPSISVNINREVPPHGSPGSIIPIRIHIDQFEPHSSMVVTEHFPKSWELTESDPPASSIDNINGTARWMIKNKGQRISIDYLLRIPTRAMFNSVGPFSGSITAGTYQQREPLLIPESPPITVTKHHWADRDGDNVIDDAEVLDAFDLYDEMQGVHIDWDSIENIWDTGSY